jgi:hypothetical protein
LDEANETVIVTLSGPVNASLGTKRTHTYTLLDNDAPPTVEFAAAASSGNEGVTPVNLEVVLSPVSGQTVTVSYAVTGGSASAGGVDYRMVLGILTFEPGETTKTVTVTIAEDALVESAETVEITLSRPSNATLGATAVHTLTITDNDTAPVPIEVTSSALNGTYGVGAVIAIRILFSKSVTVTGVPQLTLETGETDAVVNYKSRSGTATLTFSYTVATGHLSADLDYLATTALALNGGTIRDAAGNRATLTLPEPGALHSLGANQALVIDGAAPTVTDISSTSANGAYGIGAVLEVRVRFSEPVLVSGMPQLALETGPSAAVVNYSSGSGTETLSFPYTVLAGHTSPDLDCVDAASLWLHGGTIRDAVGNDATLTLPAPGALHSLGANQALVLDGAAPTVTDISSTSANGTYGIGAVLEVTVRFSEPVLVTGTPQLTLETGPTAAAVNYTSGSGTETLSFPYTVAVGHASLDLDYLGAAALRLNGGTIRDAAGNDVGRALPPPGTAHSLAWNRDFVIDTTYRLTFAAGAHGSLTGLTAQAVAYDATSSPVEAVADFGYTFVGWDDEVETNPRTLANVRAAVTLTASFREANPVAPNGNFRALVNSVDGGRRLWDLTGTYSTTIDDDLLTLALVQDTRGRLTGTATLRVTTAKAAAPVTMPVRGSVSGANDALVATLTLQGAAGAVRVSLSFHLTLNPTATQLVGPVTGSVKINGASAVVAETATLDLQPSMKGAWTLAFHLHQAGRTVTGTAVLTLSNRVGQTFEVQGHSSGADARLTLAGAPADPAARAIRIRTTITPLEGGWARLESCSGRGYGQTVNW